MNKVYFANTRLDEKFDKLKTGSFEEQNLFFQMLETSHSH